MFLQLMTCLPITHLSFTSVPIIKGYKYIITITSQTLSVVFNGFKTFI